MTGRRFAALLAAAGLTGAGLAAARPRPVEASYYPNAGPNGWDEVDNGLWVGGGLACMGYFGTGTYSPPYTITCNWPTTPYLAFQSGGVTQAVIGYEPPGYGDKGLVFYEMISGTPAMVIARGTGRVGIGTTAPTAKLEVAGNVAVNGVQAIDTTGTATKAYYAP